jgi:metallo-beta-lactamase class B
MKNRTVISLVVAAIVASAAPAQAQKPPSKDPNPHLTRARALAAEENSWRHPALQNCYPDQGQPAQKVNKDPPGFKVFDNLAYVGDGKYGPYAIDTSEGIILIDSMNSPKDVEDIIFPNMRKAGMDPARIKVLLLSHGHLDHYGGARYLQDKQGVKVYLSEADYAFAEAAAARPNAKISAPRRDVIVKDGDTITLGDVTIKAYITPGHTPGSMAFLIPVKDGGTTRTMAYIGGVTSKGLSPSMHAAYDKSFTRMIPIFQAAKVDGLLASHPNYDDAVFKNEWNLSNRGMGNAFLNGAASTVLFTKIIIECNLVNAQRDAAQPRPVASPPAS